MDLLQRQVLVSYFLVVPQDLVKTDPGWAPGTCQLADGLEPCTC